MIRIYILCINYLIVIEKKGKGGGEKKHRLKKKKKKERINYKRSEKSRFAFVFLLFDEQLVVAVVGVALSAFG